MTDEKRLYEVKKVYLEMLDLENLSKDLKKFPTAFVENCLAQKAKIFVSHKDNASAKLLRSHAFNFLAGMVYDSVQLPEVSSEFYEKALIDKPKSSETHWKAFEAIMAAQLKKVRRTEAKYYGGDEKSVFVSQIERHLNFIVQSPDSSENLKLKALRSRAKFYDSLAMPGKSYPDWRELSLEDSSDSMALSRMAAYEVESGRWQEAKASLEKLEPLSMKSPQTAILRSQVDLELRLGRSEEPLSACRRLKLLGAHPLNFPSLLRCVASFRNDGDTSTASDYLRSAYSVPRFEPYKKEIQEAMRTN